jgi:hypothetical protein
MAIDAGLLNLRPERAVVVTGTPDAGLGAVGAMLARDLRCPLVQLAPARDGADAPTAPSWTAWLTALERALPAVVQLDDLASLGLVTPDGQPTPALEEVGAWARPDRRVLVVGLVRNAWLASDAVIGRGRFARAFFVDLPDAAERDALLRTHLRAHRLAVDGLALDRIVTQTDGFTIGEIARVVAVAAGRVPIIDGTLLDALADEAARALPWSRTRHSDALRLRQMARGRFEASR